MKKTKQKIGEEKNVGDSERTEETHEVVSGNGRGETATKTGTRKTGTSRKQTGSEENSDKESSSEESRSEERTNEESSKKENTSKESGQREERTGEVETLKKDSLLEAIEAIENPRLKARFKHYYNVLNKRHTEKEGVATHVDLFITLKTILENDNRGEFKRDFDTVNDIFRKGSNGIFSLRSLSRYDYFWTSTKANYKTYHLLIAAITLLCDPVNRKENLKLINLKNIPGLSETGNANLIEYYS